MGNTSERAYAHPDVFQLVNGSDGAGGEHGADERTHRGPGDQVGLNSHRTSARNLPTCTAPRLATA